MKTLCFALVFGALLLGGCALTSTHQAKLDQTQLRDVLMDYVEEQILDNLIRARNGLPMMQFDFAHATANVTSKITPTAAGGGTVTSNGYTNRQITTGPANGLITTVVGATGNLLHSVVTPFSGSVTAERDNSITVDANPVLNDKTVYAAYLTFLMAPPDWVAPPKIETEPKFTPTTQRVWTKGKSDEPESTETEKTRAPEGSSLDAYDPSDCHFSKTENKTRGSLRWSKSPPRDPTDVLVGGKAIWKDKNYYWVPTEYKKAFFRLCLAMVARGTGAGAPGGVGATISQKLEDTDYQTRQLLYNPPPK